MTYEIAKFAGASIFEVRAADAEEVLYVYRRLIESGSNGDAAQASNEEPRRVRKFADQVNWFDD